MQAQANVTAEQVNVFDLSEQAMQEWFVDLGQPKFRARQLLQWLHARSVTDFAQMTDFSKHLRAQLAQVATVTLPEFSREEVASDGTCKWLCRLHDGQIVETVYIPERERATLCVSSQVGCGLNCSFCSTARQGFNRNLSQAEIIGQLWLAQKRLRETGKTLVTNVVFMGMGEPLLNYEPVVGAMNLMLSDFAYGLSKYRVTLSTSGLVPQMQRLMLDTTAALAVSLHAPSDDLRNTLVPINKKYNLAQLMQCCREYFAQGIGGQSRKVTFEYVMLAGVNDSTTQARQLVRLLQNVPAKLNLIPFNPHPGAQYQCSSKAAMLAFRDICQKAGIITTIRRTRGDDIAGACGQLAGEVTDRTGRKVRWMKRDGLMLRSAET